MTINYLYLAYAIAAGQLLSTVASTAISAILSYVLYLRQKPIREQAEREYQALIADAYSRQAQQDFFDRSIEG
jgi:hypothetical protein